MNSIYNEDENDESLRPKPAKRIKLENIDNESVNQTTTTESNLMNTSSNQSLTNTEQSNITNERSFSKKDLLDYFEKEYNKKRAQYVDHLLELFFS